jgi:putative heme-binding domain-containing protein
LPVLQQLAGDLSRSAEERAAAFGSLRQVGGEAVVDGLLRLAEAGSDGAIRREAAITLLAVDATRAMPLVMEAAKSLSTEREALEFWRAVLGVEQIGLPLREALGDQQFSETVGRAGMRVAREGGRDDVELVAAFAKAGGLAVDTQELTGELIQELAARAASEGDPHRGEQVYRREALACVTCHAIGGAGGKVGPDMTSIGTSAPLDYLVESLLLPNAKIKEGYHSVIIETRDGEEVTGTLARETQDEVFLRNAAGEEIGIARNNVVRRETGRLSLMPSGLVEALKPQERLDLFAFLGQLGRPGAFDASRGGIARRWRIANVIHTDIQNQQEDWYWHRPLDDRRWVGVYSLVSGQLPGEAIEAAARAEAWTSKLAVILATEIEQAAPGPIRFRPAPVEAEIWVAGQRLGNGPEVVANLPPGRHRVIVKLDPNRLPGGFRLEAEGGNFVLN